MQAANEMVRFQAVFQAMGTGSLTSADDRFREPVHVGL